MCSFIWAIFFFVSAHLLCCKRQNLRYSPTVGGRGVQEGTMPHARLLADFQSLPSLPTSNLGPSNADSQVGGCVYSLWPCGSFHWTLLWGWEFPPLPNACRFLQPKFWGLYSPVLEPWVAWSVLLPSCSSWFIQMQMWYHWVLQSPPCSRSSPPGCPSLSLLLVWMNVSSLTPWLWDFHSVCFSGNFGYFFVFKFVVLLLVVWGGKVYLPTTPS